MRCSSCGAESPSQCAYCQRCGRQLVVAQSSEPVPARQFVVAHAKSTVEKMLETPGTIILAIGILILLVAILLIIFGRWSGLGLFVISLIVLWVAVLLRGHEANIAALQANRAPTTLQSQIREVEIVKVKCRFCGSLNHEGARNCGSCGALL